MLSHDVAGSPGRDVLASLKGLSGKSIERVRRRRHITQADFARAVGLSVRWLREVEGGNPSSSLEHHLLCSQQLGIPLGQMLFPLLYLSRGMTYPLPLASLDTVELETRFVELIAERNSRAVRDFLGHDPRLSGMRS